LYPERQVSIFIPGDGQHAGHEDFVSSALLLAAAGQLDPTFGRGGKVLTSFPTCVNFCSPSANAATPQSDGKIVVAGTINTASGTGFQSVLVRYTAKGALDSTFGTGGMAMLPASTPGGGFSALAIQSDGKILAGSAQTEKGFIVARFNNNGTLDRSFGSAGLSIFGNHLPFPPVAESLLIQPDGKIVLSYGPLTRLNTVARRHLRQRRHRLDRGWNSRCLAAGWQDRAVGRFAGLAL
jgi:uncharacterized delta-60 repeat protein